jgi:hypothetical protein
MVSSGYKEVTRIILVVILPKTNVIVNPILISPPLSRIVEYGLRSQAYEAVKNSIIGVNCGSVPMND